MRALIRRFVIVFWGLPVLMAACARPQAMGPTRPAAPDPNEPPHAVAMDHELAQTLFTDAAMRPCANSPIADANAMTAELVVRGVSGGSRVSADVWVGWDLTSGALRLEPVQPWPPAFIFIASKIASDPHQGQAPDGSLVLPRGGDIQRERSHQLLYPLLGVPLTTLDLTAVLTGCPSLGGSIVGHPLGSDMFRVLLEDVLPAELLFRRDADASSGWRLFAMGRITPGGTLHWRADFGHVFRPGFRDTRVRSQEWNGVLGRRFDVNFSWRRLALDTTLDQQLFVPEAPSRRPLS